MCGIHLIIAKKPASADQTAALQRMLQASAYRGPDAAHQLHWQNSRQQVWLGGQRLKITDMDDRANQPMVSPDGRYALLYNGELYNFYELRNQLLSKGETFSTHSDTEVVLKMLIRQGQAAFSEFEGMFALAFYDRAAEVLTLARDPFGIKPLYYAENDHYFLASSSSQSLLASGLVSTELDSQQIDHYLCFRYPQKTRTLYQNIHQLAESSYLMVSPTQPAQTQSFASPASTTVSFLPDEAELLRETETLLKDAVLRHIATDVPTGLFLSGGVDSTLLLALIKEEGAHPIPTFSLVNDPKEKNFGTQDYQYSRLAAQQYGSYHQEVTLSQALFEEHFETFVQHMDQPVGDSGAMMTYLLSQEAKKQVKVVLSGAGADELFGGYNRHGAYYQYLRHYTLINNARKLGKKLVDYLPTGFPHPLRKPFRLAKKFTQSLSGDPATTFLHFIRSGPANHCPEWHSPPQSLASSHPDFVEYYLSFALQHDQHHYLIEDVLQLSDRASMAHSLELRVPYLDAPIVRHAQALPASFRLGQGKKWILRKLLNQRGGQTFTRRPKEGFGLPFGHWLLAASSPIVSQYLEDPQQLVFRFLPYNEVQHLLIQHRNGRQDYSSELWSVLLLSAWITRQNSLNK
uniref:asparagine synthase (glutamine-hydrolyzing) n=1 Tax=Roseihalotalea indica TaxID=2867963 RepID=A0AA49JK14_9BACT|nr:asparagine synthase (glutamine-hydrolyzing) [Tunicatimonas sp. TK19036]